MWGDIHFTKMQERLRAQQRALRQPRRARPLDPRTTIDRRVQQEARRMGISPMALYQQREFLQKQAKELTEQLKKAQVPEQVRLSMQNIPSEVARYMNIQEILNKVTQQYNKQFDSKIQNLQKQRENVLENISRRYSKGYTSPSPSLESQYDNLGAQIRTLQSHKQAGNVLFKDALTHAQSVGTAQGQRTADELAYQRRVERYYEAQRAPTPTVTVEDIPPKTLGLRPATREIVLGDPRTYPGIEKLPVPKPFDFLKYMLGIR